MDEPLDFESEISVPTSVSNKRKKVIGLDDLLSDHYSEKGKLVEQESNRAKAQKNYDSDDGDVTNVEALLSQCFDECQQKIEEIGGEDENSLWGMQLFRSQVLKSFPPLDFPELRSYTPLQSFMNNELNSLLELSHENAESLLQGLLLNGWLLKLVFSCGNVEKSIAVWTMKLMLYSSQEDLRTAACDFWHAILSFNEEDDVSLVEIHWFPDHLELKRALEFYGFIFDFSAKFVQTDSDCGGPPQNIRAWIKFLSACCQFRNVHMIYSNSEAEELVGVIICLFLDRKLQGLLVLLSECLLSSINYFADEHWNASCRKIAKYLASRVPKDLNCLRMVECISGINSRSKSLKSALAYETLVVCFDSKVIMGEDILKLVIKINLKEKSCDLFKVYIYLVLIENWLLSLTPKDKPVIYKMWSVYLRNCSFQIAGADLRTYAVKIRTKALFLLQGAINT